MKTIIISTIILLLVIDAEAQSYNPYVTQGVITPAILNDAASSGVGELSFEIGNSGNALPLVANQEMVIILSLSRGVPNNVNPVAAISGNYSGYFNWLYHAASYTYQGMQNQTIPAYSSGQISIDYKVISNSEAMSPQNGFNVNITPPPYTNGLNNLNDDQQDAYAYTQVPNTPNLHDPVQNTQTGALPEMADQPVNITLNENNEAQHQSLPQIVNGKVGEDEISLYPNPSVDYLNVEIKSSSKTKYEIKVSDLGGKTLVVTEAEVSKGKKVVRLSTSSLASGIYHVAIIGEKETNLFKITVIH